MPQFAAPTQITPKTWAAIVCLSAVPLLSGCNASSNQAAKNVQTYNDADGNLESITFMGHAVNDSDLARLSSDTTLKELLFQECDQITDEGFSAIAGAKELTSLQVQHVPITDKALEALKGFTLLTDLQLINTNITGSGLQYLADSPVQQLRLQGEALTSAGLAEGIGALDELETFILLGNNTNIGDVPALGSLKELQEFDASRASVGPSGLESLTGLTNLRKLMLASSEVTDKDVDALSSLVELEELHLLKNSISDAGFARLQLPKLKTLMMAGCETITDAGLSNLTGLPQLETLNIQYAPGLKGMKLGDLAAFKNLKSFTMTGGFFAGDQASIDALKESAPELQISLSSD